MSFTKVIAQNQAESPEPIDNTIDSMSPAETETDTALIIHPVNLAADSIQYLKKLPDYAYMKNLDSILKAAQKPLQVHGSKDNSFIAQLILNVLQPLLWIIAGFIVAFIIYRIFITRGLFSKQSKEQTSTAEEQDLDLSREYQPLIQQAKEKGDYRTAIRYWFLETLKNLNEKEHIVFSKDKTNSTYFFELPSSLKTTFSQLTTNYELVWYGNQTVEPSAYQTMENNFIHFNHNL